MTTVVIGLGHPDRGDDAVGLVVAERIERERPAGVEVDRMTGSPLRLLSRWSDDDDVIVVDALRGDAPPGTIGRFDAGDRPLPGRHGGGSHDTSLHDAVELARALGRLPRTLVVYGVVGRRFGVGDTLTTPVLDAVATAVERIIGEAAAPPTVAVP